MCIISVFYAFATDISFWICVCTTNGWKWSVNNCNDNLKQRILQILFSMDEKWVNNKNENKAKPNNTIKNQQRLNI